MATTRSAAPEGYGHRIFSSIKKLSDRGSGADEVANDHILSPQKVSFEIRLDEIKNETLDSKQPPS